MYWLSSKYFPFFNHVVATLGKVSCGFTVIKGDPKVTNTTNDHLEFIRARFRRGNNFFLAIVASCFWIHCDNTPFM